jgi:uncharacterized caspase-like protein
MLRWFFIVSTLFVASKALAEGRVAFIVGNSGYENTAPLSNPVNDARLVTRSLQAIGFDVTTHVDLSRAEFGTAISDFLARTDGADVAIFYFAGHGMQLDGENYLLPIDASLRSEFDVLSESVSLSTIADAMRRRAKSVLIFVDACRNNPLADVFYERNSSQTRSLTARGLAPVASEAVGSMIMFAASPDEVAYDGVGSNSPFSLAIARHLPTPNTEILTLTKRITADVRALTQDRQRPIVTNDIAQEIYLLEVTVDATNPPEMPLVVRASQVWSDFRDSSSPQALEAFAAEFEGTSYASLALETAARLRREEEDALDGLIGPRPEWCDKPANDTERLICRDQGLLMLDAEVADLSKRKLDTSRSGAERGQAMIELVEWRANRDACGSDRSCITQLYELRRTVLLDFTGSAMPIALVINSIQAELNRLSCGAGEPDGVAGAQTARAYALLASLEPGLDPKAALDSTETLATLQAIDDGRCSFVVRAQSEPKLMEGIWKVLVETCPDSSAGWTRRFRLSYDGNGTYSGKMAYSDGSFSRAVGALLEPKALRIIHVTDSGSRQSFYFQPSDAPDRFVGIDENRCSLVASR